MSISPSAEKRTALDLQHHQDLAGNPAVTLHTTTGLDIPIPWDDFDWGMTLSMNTFKHEHMRNHFMTAHSTGGVWTSTMLQGTSNSRKTRQHLLLLGTQLQGMSNSQHYHI